MYEQDPPEIVTLSDTQHRARKWHDCEACPLAGPPKSAMIPPGQLYRKIVIILDGEFQIHRQCVGACPNAEPCATCNGTGEADGRSPCYDCDGLGKRREL